MSRTASSILLLLVAMTSIQFGASFAKQIFHIAHPAGITMLRTSLAALFLLALWRPWRATWDRSAWLHVLPYGAALGIMNLLFYMSLQRIPLGIAVAVEFTGPLGLALLSSRRKQDLLWVALAALGIILISPITGHDALDPIGLLLALGAGFCWALYIVFGQRMGRRIPAGTATALGMLVAALVTIPVGAFYVNEEFFQAKVWWMGLMVAILSSALPYSLEMSALKHLPTKTFGILMSLEPALAALMGLLFLHETLNLQQVLAMACIMAASAGCTLLSSEVKEA
jgi:inner membrane transporter RhtA